MHNLGIYKEQKTLKVALLHKESQSIKIDLLRTLEIEENVKPLYILGPVLAGKKVKITSGLNAWEVLFRETTLKIANRRAVEKALPFQLETLIPFPLEEAVVHPFFKKVDKKNTCVSFFAAKTAQVEAHLEDLKILDLNPDQISSVPQALYRFARFVAPHHPDLIVFHFDEEKSTFLSIVSGKLNLSQTLNIGKADQLQKDLMRMASFLDTKGGAPYFLLTGELPPDLENFIKSSLMPAFSFVFPAIAGHNFSELQPYAIPIGLALDDGKDELQFRQGILIAPQETKKRKKLITTYLAACLALTLVLGIGSFSFKKKRENALFERLSNHFEVTDDESLADAMDRWEQKIASLKLPFSYALTVPKVSDLLVWLSTHPKLEGIEIKKVHYLLTKFPKIGKESEGYEAKVELEFTALSPRTAREFHDALMEKNDFINSKSPISWNVNQETYQTSFILNKKKAS